MNRDDIIKWAQHVAIYVTEEGRSSEVWWPDLMAFAKLVAAAEREACCSIVYGQCGSDNVAQRTVDAIQARSK